jgi:hypothetical protein
MWVTMGRKVALYELEDTKDYHLHRRLSQIIGDARMSDPDWVKANGETALALFDEHRAELNALGDRMWVAEQKTPSLMEMAEWIEQRVAEKCELIIVDPVTGCLTGQARFMEDGAFMMRVKAAIMNTDTRLILMTHPRMGGLKKADLEGMAGGLAYARFAQSIMWLQAHDPPLAVKVKDGQVTRVTKCNRSLKLCKTRNAKGEGLSLGFVLDKSTLCFKVEGVIQHADEE